MVTPHEIEGLFAADLAFLQDFYGVINFGNQEEYEALLAAQAASAPLTGSGRSAPVPAAGGKRRRLTTGHRPKHPVSPGRQPRARVEEIPRSQG